MNPNTPTVSNKVLNLALPELTLLHRQEPQLQIKDLEAWIAELPIANVAQTANQAYRMLKRLNRMSINAQTRFQFTQLLVSPIDQVLCALEKYSINAVLPLSTQNRQLIFIGIYLTEELGIAYKWVVNDLLTKGKQNYAERELLAEAFFYAAHQLANLIYIKALIYQPAPIGVWRELHELFLFAGTNRLASSRFKVRLGRANEDVKATLRDLYLRALLFATAATIRLRPREIRALYWTLPQWSGAIKLKPLSEVTHSETSFIVKLDDDQPPKHSALEENLVVPNALKFDTSPLIKILGERINLMPSELTATHIGRSLEELSKFALQRLIQAWSTAPQRYFTRTQLNFDLPLAIGFNAIYSILKNDCSSQYQATSSEVGALENSDLSGMNFAEDTDNSPNLMDLDKYKSFLDMRNLDGVEVEGIKKSVDTSEDANAVSGFLDLDRYRGFSLATEIKDETGSFITHKDLSPAPQIWSREQTINAEERATIPPYITLSTVNESIGGYCVEWRRKNVPGIKIGELIGISIPMRPHSCSLAVVRWIRDAPEEKLQVGLQLLVPSVEAITLIHQDPRQLACKQPTLIPALKSVNSPINLIVPLSTLHMEDDDLFIKDGNVERHIHLTKLVDNSGAFAHFHCEYE